MSTETMKAPIALARERARRVAARINASRRERAFDAQIAMFSACGLVAARKTVKAKAMAIVRALAAVTAYERELEARWNALPLAERVRFHRMVWLHDGLRTAMREQRRVHRAVFDLMKRPGADDALEQAHARVARERPDADVVALFPKRTASEASHGGRARG